MLSCYDFHVLNGVDVGRDLHRLTHRGGGRYKPLLEHVARRKGRRQAVIRVRPDQLDRLYGEYVWRLCEAGADLATDDFDATCVFVNLDREPLFAPWRPESVHDLVDRLRRQLSGQVPQDWTPHWMRHFVPA